MAAGVAKKTPAAASWVRFAGSFIAALFGIFALSFLFILVTDPFDRGHPVSLLPAGVLDENPRTANVSRGHDPRFNAAIFGNSHVQLIDPDRLSGFTGFQFVQMSTPAAGSREQTALMQWFMRNHPSIRAMVVGIDDRWCEQDSALPLTHPFPFWLYGSDLNYFMRVVSTRSLEHGWRRLRIARDASPVTDPSGYWDYEQPGRWAARPPAPADRPPVDLSPASTTDMEFPALDQLESVSAQLPADTMIVLVMPPVYYTSLPAADSAEARQMAGCKFDLLRRAAQRHWHFIDFYSDTPLSHDPENFWDATHVRMNIARVMEMRIAEEVSQLSHIER